jgi:methylated-DNA-[protein]-cysteine S-methyltransferase
MLRWGIEQVDTPLGALRIVTDEEGLLRSVDWADVDLAESETHLTYRLRLKRGHEALALRPLARRSAPARAIAAYFEGDLGAIDAVPVHADGTTFQQAVWGVLRTIPCGSTASYADVARRIGRPSALRAVGLANNANPIGIVVPCHRVIGSDGSLTGYGGGLERKRWLLAHESRLRN